MTEPLTAATIAELERLDAQAPPPPWSIGPGTLTGSGWLTAGTPVVMRLNMLNGAEYIAALRNAAPALLQSARRAAELAGEVERLKAELADEREFGRQQGFVVSTAERLVDQLRRDERLLNYAVTKELGDDVDRFREHWAKRLAGNLASAGDIETETLAASEAEGGGR